MDGTTHDGTLHEPCGGRYLYVRLLTWFFTLFSSLRLIAYLPTTWSIYQSNDSSQHSLWTWLTWFGANLTTAAWLYEKDGRCLGRVAIISASNAGMCLAVSVLIVLRRL